MRVTRLSGQWRPMLGVVVLGVFAFGLTLQGAPTKDKLGGVDKKGGAGQQDLQVIGGSGALQALNGKLPVLPPVVVDYRDDDMTRARERGEVVPEAGGVALLGCSNDEECNDCNPCTEDLCKWNCLANPGTQCRETAECPVGDECPTYTLGTCTNRTYNLGSEVAADCDDGVFCNGNEVCLGTPAVCATNPVSQCGTQGCDEAADECIDPCTVDGDCDDNQFCTTDTCDVGTGNCLHDIIDCGLGGRCSEGTTSYICSTGRCCDYSVSPASCTDTLWADCAPPKQWLGVNDCGHENPADDIPCPRYGSGIIDGSTLNWQYPFGTEADVVALGPAGLICDPLTRIGDDYTLDMAESYLDLEVIRFAGGVMPGPSARFSIELRDSLGNLIEDVWYFPLGNAIGGSAIRTVLFDPPLPIPKSGFVTMSVQPFFSPGGRIFWLSTKAPETRGLVAVDRGTNDDAKLYINGTITGNYLGQCNGGTRDGLYCSMSGTPSVTCPGGSCVNVEDILAFEMIGTPRTAAPLGACCSTTAGTCQNTLPWACVGKFKGVGTFCGVCVEGTVGQPCNIDAECDGTVPGSGRCASQFCNISLEECDPVTDPCPPNAGDCINIANVCSTRACCETDGSCSTVTGIGEPCPTGTAQAYASDCEPNCCTQPTVSGWDNCDLAGAHATNIPLVGVWPNYTQTVIVGNNSAATFDDWNAEPKWCSFGQYSPYGQTKDPGWWEAFTLDDCAYIRVELCCTDPVLYPAWAGITVGCPCQTVVQQVGVDDPIGLGVGTAGHARGAPYCEEDNTWGTYGPLAPGVYYYPIYSAPDGSFGVIPGAVPPGGGTYRLNIYAARCASSQCCYLKCSNSSAVCELDIDCPGGTCVPTCTITDILDCQDNLRGFWKSNIGECTGTICNTGSCCPAPGVCVDTVGGGPVDKADCDLLEGTYRGGGLCVDDPCPVCPFGAAANCLPSDGGFVTASDLDFGDNGTRKFDDFIAAIDLISEVCVNGTWIDDASTQARIDCACVGDDHDPAIDCVSRIVDKFEVSIYQDAAGLPGTFVGSSTVTTWGRAIAVEYGNFDEWTVNLQLDTPIAVQPGQTYWLSVVNDTDEPLAEDCHWSWASNGGLSGNNWSASDSNGVIEPQDAESYDMVFCLDQVLEFPPQPQGRCCICQPLGLCVESDLYRCEGMPFEPAELGGSWERGGTCTPNTCPSTRPAGDTCTQGAVQAVVGVNSFSTQCATNDGPNPVTCAGAASRIGRDVWYYFIPPSTGAWEINFCSNGGWDGELAIYTNNTGTCPCPTTNGTLIDCNDESCESSGGPPSITRPMTAGTCYLLRIGGWVSATDGELDDAAQAAGTFIIQPGSCEFPAPAPAVADSVIPKRVKHLTVTAPGGEERFNALRVKLTLAYCIGGSNPGAPCDANGDCLGGGTCAPSIGQSWYVGEPREVAETAGVSGLGTPPRYWLAQLQTAPVYKDWSAYPLLHLYGRWIAPNCTYEVALAPQGCEGIESAYSTVLVMQTSKWGDVAGTCAAPTSPSCVTMANGYKDCCNAPQGVVDFVDISAVVDKFSNKTGALHKARADVFGPGCIPEQIIDFSDIPNVVDAFRGVPYSAACAP